MFGMDIWKIQISTQHWFSPTLERSQNASESLYFNTKYTTKFTQGSALHYKSSPNAIKASISTQNEPQSAPQGFSIHLTTRQAELFTVIIIFLRGCSLMLIGDWRAQR
jgi:hypothetical protein